MRTPCPIVGFLCLLLWVLLPVWSAPAQKIPTPGVPGREHVEIKRLRPADIHLAKGTTIRVDVIPIDSRSLHLVSRLKKIITNGVIGANRSSLRESLKSPQVLIECSITRCEYTEKTEQETILGMKNKGMFKNITFMLEASYKVVRTKDQHVYFADNVTLPYKNKFQIGVQSTPGKSEIEDGLMGQVIKAILAKLSDTKETHKVRLMGKGDLSRYARLAQGGQWVEYVNSVNSLPAGNNEFEGDRHYNLCIAYEAQFYDKMWKDYSSADILFNLADTMIRKAQSLDPREKEYVNALTRLLQGKIYFDTIRERYPPPAPKPASTPGRRKGKLL